jgi:hypothetical protein
MPWCETCSRYQPSGALQDDGACPDCEEVLGPPPKAPWHFKLLIVAVVLYLGWRAVQGVAWVVHKL